MPRAQFLRTRPTITPKMCSTRLSAATPTSSCFALRNRIDCMSEHSVSGQPTFPAAALSDSLREDIVTTRLSLIAITPEMLFSEKNNDGRLGELIQSVIPANWPPTDWEPHVLDFLLAQFAENLDQLGWCRYVSFVRPDGHRALIGTLGAFTRDGRPSECE